MMEPITVPPAAAQRVAEIVQRRQAIEQELASAIAMLAAALGAPDGWQLQVLPDGAMVFVVTASEEPAASS